MDTLLLLLAVCSWMGWMWIGEIDKETRPPEAQASCLLEREGEVSDGP